MCPCSGREWAYTALSRARGETVIYAVETPTDRDPEGAQHWRVPTVPVDELLAARWGRSGAKDSTLDYAATWPGIDVDRDDRDLLPLRPAMHAPGRLVADDDWSAATWDDDEVRHGMEAVREL